MISADVLARAHDVPLGSVLALCDVQLRREGAELVGPCPRCGGDDRFAVNLRKGVFNCRGCGGKGAGAIDLIMFVKACPFADAIELLTGEHQPIPPPKGQPPPPQEEDDDDAAQMRKARWLWARRKPVKGTPAETYLRDVRG